MSDNELFELCKEVHQRTEWETDTRIARLDGEWQYFTKDDWNKLPMKYIGSFFLYTSDYLLEKLPNVIHIQDTDVMNEPHVEVHHSGVVKPQFRWCAKAFNGDWFEVDARTPLKALLKLTIALHKAGELHV